MKQLIPQALTAAITLVFVGSTLLISQELAQYRSRAQVPSDVAITATADAEMLSGGLPEAAQDVQIMARCSATQPGLVVVTATWNMPSDRGTQMRLEVTSVWDGFQKDTFQSFGAMPPPRPTSSELNRVQEPQAIQKADGSVTWERDQERMQMELEIDLGGYTDYFRVLAMSDAGWAPSDVYEIELPVCPVDG